MGMASILQPVIQCPNVHGARELINYSTSVIQTGERTNGMQVCEGGGVRVRTVKDIWILSLLHVHVLSSI